MVVVLESLGPFPGLVFGNVNFDKAVKAGLKFRPVQQTVSDTLAWWPSEMARRERVGKDKTTRITGNFISVVGKDRTLKTVGGMLSHAKTHSIVAEDSIHLTVGVSSIFMDKEKIVITSGLVKLDHEDPRHHREENLDAVSALTGRPARSGT